MNTSDCISKDDVDIGIKEIIAKEKSRDSRDIFLQDKLREDLNFNNGGIRQLSVPINDKNGALKAISGLSVTPKELVALKTVGDIAALIWGKIPDREQCPFDEQ